MRTGIAMKDAFDNWFDSAGARKCCVAITTSKTDEEFTAAIAAVFNMGFVIAERIERERCAKKLTELFAP